MKNIEVNMISEFMDYYHWFHDSNIINVSYDISNSRIEVLINAFWSGKTAVDENGIYETNPTKVKMIFTGIEECNVKMIESFDSIEDAYFNLIKHNNKDLYCFSDDKDKPNIYIISDKVEYEEVKD